MKKHQCSRCKRHVSHVVEVAKKTGSRREYCESCIQTMRNKGANVKVSRSSDSRSNDRRASSNAASIDNRSNRK